MNTDRTLRISSTSSEDTEKLGEYLGVKLKGGEVIELLSDIGGGKTTFVRGLVRGFGSSDMVSSPTYTIKQVYKARTKELHHFDFYRLADAGLVGLELAEDIGQPDVVTVIEWAEIVHNVLPQERLTISFKRENDTEREIECMYPDQLQYLFENLPRL